MASTPFCYVVDDGAVAMIKLQIEDIAKSSATEEKTNSWSL